MVISPITMATSVTGLSFSIKVPRRVLGVLAVLSTVALIIGLMITTNQPNSTVQPTPGPITVASYDARPGSTDPMVTDLRFDKPDGSIVLPLGKDFVADNGNIYHAEFNPTTRTLTIRGIMGGILGGRLEWMNGYTAYTVPQAVMARDGLVNLQFPADKFPELRNTAPKHIMLIQANAER